MHIHTQIINRLRYRYHQLSALGLDLATLASLHLVQLLPSVLAAMFLNHPLVLTRLPSLILPAGCEKNMSFLDYGLTSTILFHLSSRTFPISRKGLPTQILILRKTLNPHAVIGVLRLKRSSFCSPLRRTFSLSHP
jgi:hypothetical protein